MNIEEFYEQDERRRQSQELELGSDWRDANGVRYEVSFVVDTGELYTMTAPPSMVAEDTFGDVEPLREPLAVLSVEVLAHLPSIEALHAALAGWEDKMREGDSISWLKGQVRGFPAT